MRLLKLTQLARVLFAALFICLSLSYSVQSLSQDKYSVCDEFTVEIEDAVKKWFPDNFQEPLALKSQYYQESLCNLTAQSHVGASGIAQFMPQTALEVGRFFGVSFDPTSRKAIEYGAYYQSRQMKSWARRNRTAKQAWELGLAGYNAGKGNILRAQRACNNARLWDEINPCLYKITGHHHKETIGYVRRIKLHWDEMIKRGYDKPPKQCQYEIVKRARWK